MSAIPIGQDKFVEVNDLQLHDVEWGNPEAFNTVTAAFLQK